MLKITVDNRVRLDPSNLSVSAVLDLKNEFDHKNPAHFALKARFRFPPKHEPAVISTWGMTDGIFSCPRGGLGRVIKVLKNYDIDFYIEEGFTKAPPVDFPPLSIRLYDYQQRCMIDSVSSRSGLVKAPTGSGKTITGIATIAELQTPVLVVVQSNALLKQWVDRIEKSFEHPFEIGIIQGRNFNLRPITIGMAQTLGKLDEYKWMQINSYFGGVIQDEVQFAAAATFMKVIDKCKMAYRIGLSADHTRQDKKEFLIRDLFGDVIAEVSRNELIAREIVHDVKVVMEPTKFTAEWFLIQRAANDLRKNHSKGFDQIYEELVKRWPSLKMADVPTGQPDYNRLLDEMGNDEERNTQIVTRVADMVKDGHRTLVFCHRIDHCHLLIQKLTDLGIKAGALIGGPENRKEFDSTIDSIQNGDTLVGVGTWQALGTGIDCPRVSRGLMATPINGKQIWGQIRGRICRTSVATGKTDAEIVYMWDRDLFFDVPVKNMNSWNTLSVVNVDPQVSAKEYLKQRRQK